MSLIQNRLFSKIPKFTGCLFNITGLTTHNQHTKHYTNESTPKYERRVFSGIQPTGVPHLGNYFGAIKPWVETQQRWGNMYLCVVDLHAITMPGHNPQQLRQQIQEMFASLLACGIDPQKTCLFQQSAIARHGELCWILGCLTSMPRLQHLPQWKVKSDTMTEVPLGLFTYPVLQAADILLYKSTDVPVGDDQVKHIELARDLAKLFNKKYGETFPKPKSHVGVFNRIKSLRSPGDKMSKSDKDPKSCIFINDTTEVIQEKVKKAVTDFTSYVSYEPTERPGVANLVNIHCGFTGLEPEEVCEQSLHLDMLGYKYVVAEAVCEGLSDIRTKFEDYMKNKEYLEHIIKEGNGRAQEIAETTHQEVMEKVGFV